MRRRTQKDAYEYAWLCKNYYETDNQWAGMLTGGATKSPPEAFKGTVVAAAAAYGRVPKDKDAILLLGDTKIRSDAEFILNFGLSGDTGSDPDPETCQMILWAMGKKDAFGALCLKDLDKYRKEIEAGQSAGVRGTNNKKDTPLYGSGSLLSNPSWSPILNDAFILSGIHTNLTFVLALNKSEQEIWGAHKASAVATLTKRYETEVKKERLAKEAWLTFLRENQRVIWDPELKVPRVFLRELLGLKAFGYTPQFSEYQLSFACTSASKADDSNFLPYVELLNTIGFHDTSKKPQILRSLSEWLFDDASALDSLSAGAKS